jgi:hypothetical protein
MFLKIIAGINARTVFWEGRVSEEGAADQAAIGKIKPAGEHDAAGSMIYWPP